MKFIAIFLFLVLCACTMRTGLVVKVPYTAQAKVSESLSVVASEYGWKKNTSSICPDHQSTEKFRSYFYALIKTSDSEILTMHLQSDEEKKELFVHLHNALGSYSIEEQRIANQVCQAIRKEGVELSIEYEQGLTCK